MQKYQDSNEKLQKIVKRYEPQAKKYFNQPAERCQLCGKPITFTGEELTDRWIRRWSIHPPCAEAIENQLDRQTGILSERR